MYPVMNGPLLLNAMLFMIGINYFTPKDDSRHVESPNVACTFITFLKKRTNCKVFDVI